jgi:uncharacterized protein YfaP (DUF2135 family)
MVSAAAAQCADLTTRAAAILAPYGAAVRLYTVDVDVEQGLAQVFQVQAVPAMLALIQGRVAAKRKSPATLVVNGAAMPLLADESGHYARPYAFGAGSNGVEVRDGKAARRVQFYEANAGKPQARLRVLLSWDTPGTDLDLHVISPDGQHVFYGRRVAQNGGALDVDVTTGYGPEIYASPAPLHGVYHVYVNYYGGGRGEDDAVSARAITLAQVAVVSQEGTLSEKRQVAQVPMRNPGELTLVKSFSYP